MELIKYIAIYTGLLLASSTVMAMDSPGQPKPRLRFDTISAFLPGPLPGTTQEVKVLVQLEVPESQAVTHEQACIYFQEHEDETKAQLMTTLTAYLERKQQDIELMKVTPVLFLFNPSNPKEHTFTPIQYWGEHTVNGTTTVELETYVPCTYSPETETLLSSPFTIKIKESGVGKEHTLAMDRLREFYPDRDNLEIQHETSHQLRIASFVQCMQKLMQGQSALPDDYYDSIYLQDILRMVAYYLKTVKK